MQPTHVPCNIEAEQSILGAVLIRPDSILQVPDLLPVDFYREPHALIWDAMLTMHDAGIPIDLLSLTDYLIKNDQLKGIGGATYLSTLAAGVMTAWNIKAHADIVKEASWRRKVAFDAQQIGAYATDSTSSVEELGERIQRMLFSLAARGNGNCAGAVHIGSVMRGLISNIEKAYQNPGVIDGLLTGYTDLDTSLCGIRQKELIILAGRPSMGKTGLALNVVRNVIRSTNGAAGFFSLEMSKEELGARAVTLETAISGDRLRRGQITKDEFDSCVNACSDISQYPLFIDDRAGLTIYDIRSQARKWKLEHGIKLVIVDYLQIMRATNKAERRDLQIAEFTAGLKAMAKELSIPVLALSQLSRDVEKRTDKRPVMADLRDGGAIEQDADVVIFIYRDEVYNPGTSEKNIAEIRIEKHRNGQTGFVKLAFRRPIVRFDNLARHQEDRWGAV